MKWTLNLDPCTPDFIMYNETDIEKIRTIAGYRAVSFERAIKEGNRKLVIECIKEKEKGGIIELREEKERNFRENGFSSEGVKMLREREMNVARMVREQERR